VYEYFLTKFALQEGKGKGEFYTPKTVVNLIAEMIEPYKGKIYDPCCGSGGMFVQSLKFVENHAGSTKDISVYGQEGTSTTYKMAKMNLAIRGIPCDLGEKAANTFTNGALSGEGQELEIRKQLIENNLVEAIVILPRNLFYTTDISVTLWILNKNKKARVIQQNGKMRKFRDRQNEVLLKKAKKNF